MQSRPNRHVVALVDDVMVRSRIEAAASADTQLRFPTSAADFEAQLEAVPDLVVVGLSATRLPWQELIARARLRGVQVVAFGPHKDLELRARALEAGADRVLANSAFMLALPALLKGEAPSVTDDEVP